MFVSLLVFKNFYGILFHHTIVNKKIGKSGLNTKVFLLSCKRDDPKKKYSISFRFKRILNNSYISHTIVRILRGKDGSSTPIFARHCFSMIIV